MTHASLWRQVSQKIVSERESQRSQRRTVEYQGSIQQRRNRVASGLRVRRGPSTAKQFKALRDATISARDSGSLDPVDIGHPLVRLVRVDVRHRPDTESQSAYRLGNDAVPQTPVDEELRRRRGWLRQGRI